ncbi:MAG: type 1 glutamine amidotransferase domain-containing protein [Longimicrobiales bacterium]
MTRPTVNDTGHDLSERKVAVLATNGFEESELLQPLSALKKAGAHALVVSLPNTPNSIKGWADGNWGEDVPVDGTVGPLTADDFDALVLPGGVINPDLLRADAHAVDFVRSFFEQGKPVAAICHGPWMVVEAGAADGRTMTSYPSIRTDVQNAGAEWVDRSVVVDQGLVTSRSPADLEDFIDKMLEEIGEGVHAGQHA